MELKKTLVEADIDHANIQNIGTNAHIAIDTHIVGTGASVHGDSFLLNTGDTGVGDYNFSSNVVINSSGTNPIHLGYSGALTQFPGFWALSDGTPSLTNYRLLMTSDNEFNVPVGRSNSFSIGNVPFVSLKGDTNSVYININKEDIDFIFYSDTLSDMFVLDAGINAILTLDSVPYIMGKGGDSKDYFDGTNRIIDPNVVGAGKVLIGATANDDLGLENIEIHGYIKTEADLITDIAPVDDTTQKRVSVQKLAVAPTNAAYIPFQNNPGTDTFYLVLEEV